VLLQVGRYLLCGAADAGSYLCPCFLCFGGARSVLGDCLMSPQVEDLHGNPLLSVLLLHSCAVTAAVECIQQHMPDTWCWSTGAVDGDLVRLLAVATTGRQCLGVSPSW
jgi:hypothetical protein